MALAEHKQVAGVLGFGARTAVGASARATAAAIRASIAMFADHPYMIDKAGAPMVVARDAFLSEEVLGIDRFVEIGQSAAVQSLRSLAGSDGSPLSVHLLIGLPTSRPGLPSRLHESIGEAMKRSLKEFADVVAVNIFPTGHAAGLMALEEGWRRISSGAAECCLVGGIDSYLEPETLEWLDDRDCLHSENNSWGFIPGEAAGFCLLGSLEFARRHRLKVLGEVVAAATAREKNLNYTGTVCLGEGLTQVFREVIWALPSPASKIDYMICDLNGDPYRGDEFGYAMVRTSGRFANAGDFLNPADCWGDVGAASGPLFVVLALSAAAKGFSKAHYTLVWTSSDSGERSAALLHANVLKEL